jgi:hypothetical protein
MLLSTAALSTNCSVASWILVVPQPTPPPITNQTAIGHRGNRAATGRGDALGLLAFIPSSVNDPVPDRQVQTGHLSRGPSLANPGDPDRYAFG